MSGELNARWLGFCKVIGTDPNECDRFLDFMLWIQKKWVEWEKSGGSRFDGVGFDRWLSESIDGN